MGKKLKQAIHRKKKKTSDNQYIYEDIPKLINY